MSILEELSAILTRMGVPFETGAFKNKPPDEFVVIVPLTDRLALFADNKPRAEIQEARLSVFVKNDSFVKLRNSITHALLAEAIDVTDRRYIGFESDTGYHHYVIEAAKAYPFDAEAPVGEPAGVFAEEREMTPALPADEETTLPEETETPPVGQAARPKRRTRKPAVSAE